MKNLLIILTVPLLLFSCKKKIYHSFTDEEKAFLVYDQGETFKLKDENTDKVLEFTVTDKYLIYQDDSGPTSGGRKEHFMEQGEIKFSDGSGLNSGYIYI